MYLDPKKNFDHIPPPLRPRRRIRVNKGFATQLAEIDRDGKRANSGTIGNVMMVLDDMREKTPKLFTRKIKRHSRKRLTRRHKPNGKKH